MGIQYNIFAPQILSDETRDGVRHITVAPSSRVCSQQIDVDIKDDIVLRVKYTGGCDGNTQGVAALAAGMKVSDACERLRGIDCRGRGTSCPDQLSQALLYALEK